MNVLIADDERVTRHTLQTFLQDWGMQVSTARDGREAWDLYRRGDFDMVISDWNMPRLTGLELIQKIRNDQANRYCYLILLTARSEKSDLVGGLNAGADDFLSKPFDRNELRARLRAGERILTLQHQLEEKNRRLQEVNQRMEKDLAAAARLQQSMLPDELPDTGPARFAWSFRPCEQLAGDNLNVFRLDEHRIGFYVADVSGHGVAAALLSVTINQLLNPRKSRHGLLVQPEPGDDDAVRVSDPLHVVQELNRRFPMEEFEGNYFTIIYGVLDKRTCEFRYVSAGHPAFILLRHDGVPKILDTRSYPIGWKADGQWREESLQLKPGDRLCIYSDGVADAENSQREKFGDSRLVDSLISSVFHSIDDSLAHAMLKIETWCGSSALKDDISMLAIEITD
jgi:sigma-B regulation protein RsbU (phosphoserine phosphatase)